MDYLTTAQAAIRLGISRARVLSLIKAHKLPASKAGSIWLILQSDLDTFAKLPRPEGWKKGRPRKTAE